MKKVSDLLKQKRFKQGALIDRHKYVTREFQDYGYRLAARLNDLKHKSLYIKLAKEEPRHLLDQALSFTIDYPEARNKGKIFMWKLKELKNPKEKESSRPEQAEIEASNDKSESMV